MENLDNQLRLKRNVSGPIGENNENSRLVAPDTPNLNQFLALSEDRKDTYACRQAADNADTPHVEEVDPIMQMPNQSNYNLLENSGLNLTQS